MLDKYLLAPYWLTLKARHALYDKGVWKSSSAEVPTICIGNITAGGTGKTPHTEMILNTLSELPEWREKNVAVLSRGHKRKSGGFQQVSIDGSASFYGDEPLQIKKNFPQVTVAVDRNRIEGCTFLCHPELLATDRKARKCANKTLPPADLIVLDDAFQHRALNAFMNIILVDWNRPVSKDMLLPLGRLRDLPERIEKADIIIATKCPAYLENWEKTSWLNGMGISGWDPQTCEGHFSSGRKVKVFFSYIHYCDLKPVFREEGDPRYIYSKKMVLFSGIAKDTPLRRFLSDKYQIVRRFRFSDHHKYNRFDIAHILAASTLNPTAVVATTEKDCQRLLDCKKIPGQLKERLFQVPIKVAFLSEEEEAVFRASLSGKLQEFHSGPEPTPRG